MGKLYLFFKGYLSLDGFLERSCQVLLPALANNILFHNFCKKYHEKRSKPTLSGSPERQQEAIPKQDASDPHSSQFPAGMVQVSIGSAEEIPRQQLLGGEPLSDFIFRNSLTALLGEVHDISKAETSLAPVSNLLFHGGPISLDDPCMRK